MLKCQIGKKERKIDEKTEKGSSKSESQSHDTTTHSPYVWYTMFEANIKVCTVFPQKTLTQINLEKTESCTSKGKNKSNELKSLSICSTTHHPNGILMDFRGPNIYGQ